MVLKNENFRKRKGFAGARIPFVQMFVQMVGAKKGAEKTSAPGRPALAPAGQGRQGQPERQQVS